MSNANPILCRNCAGSRQFPADNIKSINWKVHNPPRRSLVPSQQNVYTIYPYHVGGNQALMCDGSVRMITTSVSVPAWSAAVTPAGGEVLSLDQ